MLGNSTAWHQGMNFFPLRGRKSLWLFMKSTSVKTRNQPQEDIFPIELAGVIVFREKLDLLYLFLILISTANKPPRFPKLRIELLIS